MNTGIKDQTGVVLAKHGLTVESEFVPFSKSRNAGEKMPSLNWKITLLHNGRKILTTDYSAGCGHAPSYKQSFKRDYINDQMVAAECEHGGKAKHIGVTDFISVPHKLYGTIKPESRDVIFSLLMDSEVLDSDGYEGWAGNFGYDEDSRKGEAVYNSCLKIALQFRKIGESVIAELREAYQDY